MEMQKEIKSVRQVSVPNHFAFLACRIAEEMFPGQEIVFQYIDREAVPDLYRFTTIKDAVNGYSQLKQPSWFEDSDYWERQQPYSFSITFDPEPTNEKPGIRSADIRFPNSLAEYKVGYHLL